MIKTAGATSYLPDAVTPWGQQANPWPSTRGIAITGTFGDPPRGRTPNFSLITGELLTGAIIITLVASLESIAISKALATKCARSAGRARSPSLTRSQAQAAQLQPLPGVLGAGHRELLR